MVSLQNGLYVITHIDKNKRGEDFFGSFKLYSKDHFLWMHEMLYLDGKKDLCIEIKISFLWIFFINLFAYINLIILYNLNEIKTS